MAHCTLVEVLGSGNFVDESSNDVKLYCCGLDRESGKLDPPTPVEVVTVGSEYDVGQCSIDMADNFYCIDDGSGQLARHTRV